ncbi:hypothetical protein, partial [Enterococcus hirae]|uniref:hypothetical protein n=1 Tax=Enterococcus hirae TaxID=1354 RepID=UPI00136920A7
RFARGRLVNARTDTDVTNRAAALQLSLLRLGGEVGVRLTPLPDWPPDVQDAYDLALTDANEAISTVARWLGQRPENSTADVRLRFGWFRRTRGFLANAPTDTYVTARAAELQGQLETLGGAIGLRLTPLPAWPQDVQAVYDQALARADQASSTATAWLRSHPEDNTADARASLAQFRCARGFLVNAPTDTHVTSSAAELEDRLQILGGETGERLIPLPAWPQDVQAAYDRALARANEATTTATTWLNAHPDNNTPAVRNSFGRSRRARNLLANAQTHTHVTNGATALENQLQILGGHIGQRLTALPAWPQDVRDAYDQALARADEAISTATHWLHSHPDDNTPA